MKEKETEPETPVAAEEDPVVIYAYTRADALADGVLVDVSEWASSREMLAGFSIPVAFTQALWSLVEAPPGSCQDTRGRAHDVLTLARFAVARGQGRPGRLPFTVRIGRRNVELVIELHPGDSGEPVGTIMLAHED